MESFVHFILESASVEKYFPHYGKPGGLVFADHADEVGAGGSGNGEDREGVFRDEAAAGLPVGAGAQAGAGFEAVGVVENALEGHPLEVPVKHKKSL